MTTAEREEMLTRLDAAAQHLAWWEARSGQGVRTRLAQLRRGGTSYLLYQLSKRHALRTREKTFWGEKFECYLPDYFFLALYGVLGDSAEIPLTKYVVRAVRLGDSFFDIGANCGFYTLLAARLVGETGTVHAFEPTPDTFPLLARNARAYPYVSAFPYAVSDASGTAELFISRAYSVRNSLRAAYVEKRDATVNVRTIRLDDHCAATGVCPTFIKIDVEGAENMVIRGAEKTLRSVHPTVITEVRFGVDESPYRDAAEALLRLGYGSSRITAAGVLSPEPLKSLFRPRGKASFENIAFTYRGS